MDATDKNIVVINKNAIVQLAMEAGNLVIKKEAEDKLIELLTLKDLLDATIEQVKKNIAESGRKMYPDFKAIVGEKVKIITRYYGERFKANDYTKVEPRFIKTITIQKINSNEVDAFLEENGNLPVGIEESEREEKVVISLKKQ